MIAPNSPKIVATGKSFLDPMLSKFAGRLAEVTAGCRPDMHEPDEQELKARVIGDHLDNAFGDHVDAQMIVRGGQEFVVILERFFPEHGGEKARIVTEKFNLSTLIALARLAAPSVSA